MLEKVKLLKELAEVAHKTGARFTYKNLIAILNSNQIKTAAGGIYKGGNNRGVGHLVQAVYNRVLASEGLEAAKKIAIAFWGKNGKYPYNK